MPDLADVLGKSGDFSYSFAIKDQVSPAIEKMQKTSEMFQKFFDKQSAQLQKGFDHSRKSIKAFLGKDMKKIHDNVKDLMEEIEDLEDEVEDSTGVMKRFVGSLSVQSIKSFQESLEGIEGVDLKGTTESFIEIMSEVADKLGKSRGEMVSLAESVGAGVMAFSPFAASAAEGMTAVKGLTDAGVRSIAMFEDLAPKVAITARAVRGDIGDISAIFYEMSTRMDLTSDEVSEVFANWKRTSELMGIDFDKMKSTFTDSKFYSAFGVLSKDMTATTKVQTMATLGHIHGLFNNVWADGNDFINKMMGSMTDPALASELARITGMSAHAIKDSIQSVEGAESFIDRFMTNIERKAQQGTTALIPWERAMGMAEGSLLALSRNAGAIRKDLGLLQKAQIKTGKGMEFMTQRATANMGAVERWGNALSRIAEQQIPFLGISLLHIKELLVDLPLVQLYALGAVLGAIGNSAFGAELALTGLGKAVLAWLAKTQVAMAVWAGLAAPVLVWVVGITAVAGALYMVWKHFDKIMNVMKDIPVIGTVFMGIGKVIQFVGGTIQVLLGLVYGAVKAFGEWSHVSDLLISILEVVGAMGEALGGVLSKIGGAIKGAFADAINLQFVNPFNTMLGWKSPFSNKTFGAMAGITPITPLATGGVVTGPTMGLLGEAGQNELVAPLEPFYDKLATLIHDVFQDFVMGGAVPALAAGGTSKEAVQVIKTQAQNVKVVQTDVVRAIHELIRTVKQGGRIQTLPSKGSGFGSSGRAFPGGWK